MIDTIIVTGGRLSKEFALDFLEENQKKGKVMLVAADSGYEFFRTTGIKPDLAVGDFDSLSTIGRRALEQAKGLEVIYLKPEKDDSDTQSAMNFAIDRGGKEIAILGATGSRMDHMLANLGLMMLGKEKNVNVRIIDEHNFMQLIPSGTELERDTQFGNYVSFFPLGGEVKGLKLSGFKYGLNGYDLRTEDSGLTVSNEITEKTARVEYETGTLLMIMSRD